MSARAAARLRTLGFERVFRYTPGKMDWFASGLPREGTMAGHPRAGDAARRDVPTCQWRERLGDVARRVRAAGWDLCVVVDEEAVVLGLLEAAALDGDPTTVAEDAMRPGPTTFRPHLALEEVTEPLKRKEHVLITTSNGRLVGMLLRADAERHIGEIGKGAHTASR